jgi:fumarylacetoacetase
MGRPVKLSEAEDHIFGYTLLNDWSARDMLVWEMTPLGPFNAKNFGTTIGPWIVTAEALEPFKVLHQPQLDAGPTPLSYLNFEGNFSYYVDLAIDLKSSKMTLPETILTSNFKHMYWTPIQ